MVTTAVRQQLTGKTLRWVVCIALRDADRALTVAEIVATVERLGFGVPGDRPGKAVSDALRWEVRRGRVVLVKRGLYGSGFMQRSTEWSMRRRVRELKSVLPKSLVATTAAAIDDEVLISKPKTSEVRWQTPDDAPLGALLAEVEASLVAESAATTELGGFNIDDYVTAADDRE